MQQLFSAFFKNPRFNVGTHTASNLLQSSYTHTAVCFFAISRSPRIPYCPNLDLLASSWLDLATPCFSSSITHTQATVWVAGSTTSLLGVRIYWWWRPRFVHYLAITRGCLCPRYRSGSNYVTCCMHCLHMYITSRLCRTPCFPLAGWIQLVLLLDGTFATMVLPCI